jgi:hypothetical protein
MVVTKIDSISVDVQCVASQNEEVLKRLTGIERSLVETLDASRQDDTVRQLNLQVCHPICLFTLRRRDSENAKGGCASTHTTHTHTHTHTGCRADRGGGSAQCIGNPLERRLSPGSIYGGRLKHVKYQSTGSHSSTRTARHVLRVRLLCVCVRACVSVCERERESARARARERERKGEDTMMDLTFDVVEVTHTHIQHNTLSHSLSHPLTHPLTHTHTPSHPHT